VIARDTAVIEYVLECLLTCRYCAGEIAERTLVEPEFE
jgi:hypothetical protein